MKNAVSNITCPSCLQPEGIDHIDALPVEDRLQAKDRRIEVDLAYLSLIADERRQSGTNRRSVIGDAVVVEHHEARRMICLHCTHEWEADNGLTIALSK